MDQMQVTFIADAIKEISSEIFDLRNGACPRAPCLDEMIGDRCECLVYAGGSTSSYKGTYQGVSMSFVILDIDGGMICLPAALTAIRFSSTDNGEAAE